MSRWFVKSRSLCGMSSLVREELFQMREQVLSLLDRYPQTRNNDFYLQWLWLRSYGGLTDLPFLEWDEIRHLSGKFETIRRVRQKVQNEEGKFLPTDPNVGRRRRIRELEIRKSITRI
jgi:hypothetical protein